MGVKPISFCGLPLEKLLTVCVGVLLICDNTEMRIFVNLRKKQFTSSSSKGLRERSVKVNIIVLEERSLRLFDFSPLISFALPG